MELWFILKMSEMRHMVIYLEHNDLCFFQDTQVDILDNHSIILTAPASSNTFKNSTNGITKLSQK